MRQPDIGLKVAELRQQMNMTQDRLAEECEVSTRTIQRIESGEVEPRAYTRTNLSEILGFDFGQDNTENEGLWLAVLHLSGIFPLVIPPLLVWSWKKNQSYEIDRQGRLALNFQITMALAMFAATACAGVLLPIGLLAGDELGNLSIMTKSALASLTALPFILIMVFSFFQAAINTLRALSDRQVRYPLSVRFVK